MSPTLWAGAALPCPVDYDDHNDHYVDHNTDDDDDGDALAEPSDSRWLIWTLLCLGLAHVQWSAIKVWPIKKPTKRAHTHAHNEAGRALAPMCVCVSIGRPTGVKLQLRCEGNNKP